MFQIICRALYNCPRGGGATVPFNAVDWNEDPFDNALWAYSIRAFEEWRNCDVDQWMDPIVDRLMLMGCPDWVNPDNRMASSIQSMRFATVWGSPVEDHLRGGQGDPCFVYSWFIQSADLSS